MPGLQEEVEDLLRKRIVSALRKNKGNIRSAAESLQVPRSTLMSWIKRMNLSKSVDHIKQKNGMRPGPGRQRWRSRTGSLNPHRIRSLRKEGRSYASIAKEVGEPASTVRMVALEEDA